jgi:hypothetical protein
MNRFQETDSASLGSRAGRYDNPIRTWLLGPIQIVIKFHHGFCADWDASNLCLLGRRSLTDKSWLLTCVIVISYSVLETQGLVWL